MNENLVRQFAVRARSLAHYETGDRFPPSVYYNFLRVAVNSIDAKVAVELGVCGGGGSYYMARSTPKCDVIGVDHTLEYPKNIDFIERSA